MLSGFHSNTEKMIVAKKIRNHSKLGLSFAEFGALLGTRTMLANNAIVDAKGRHYNNNAKSH